ncbi:hypothetical protein H696_02985 [Fonticula alba]|uniref:Transmembrane protein n=1 Tax=Fonticula alba TaxID=691883 RepID=A0A058Z9N0_FONAL|nr:hypothetical protein H696_02985 [Fonticula alba]KCV70628.1 hypothetical protein H696_02985 [Fonticula alba]|eukprot:XP_009495144.1 hypothetical protein H696_02985 [Fonticula alba]
MSGPLYWLRRLATKEKPLPMPPKYLHVVQQEAMEEFMRESQSRRLTDRLRTFTRGNPFLSFGLPFILLVVLGSIQLSTFMQAKMDRLDRNRLIDPEVLTMFASAEARKKVKAQDPDAPRPVFNIQEEYFKLQRHLDLEQEDYENKPIIRPPGY